MNKLSYLIVDDERPNRVLLRALLADYVNKLLYIGEADGGRSAVLQINHLQPDVVFLDIHMPDLNGFDVLQQLTHQPKIVFVTAYDQYALKAFEQNTIDYLIKPVQESRLAKTVDKLLSKAAAQPLLTGNQLQQLLQQLQPPPAYAQTIAVTTGQKILLIAVEDIAWLEAKEKYVALHTTGGSAYLTSETLTALEPLLPLHFLRVQKGSIINTLMIAEIHKLLNNRLLIKLKDIANSEVTSGTSYIQNIRERLKL